MRNFYAGQKVRVKPDNDKINSAFFGLVGEVMQNEPSGQFDYYLKFDNEKFTQSAYAFNEDELEACTESAGSVVLAGNSRSDLITLTRSLLPAIREISDARRSSNLSVAYDVARYLLKNYDLTKKDGN